MASPAWILAGAFVLGFGVRTGQADLNQIRPFIWDSASGMRDLGTLGGDSSVAWDINDHGQVVGYTLIPEPATLALLAAGAGGLVLGLRRNRAGRH